MEADKYDNYGVTGVYDSGKSRTISMAKIPQSFYREITHNSDGQPSISELINAMIDIAKKENPIINKNKEKMQIKKVGDLIEKMAQEKQSNGESKAI